MAAASSTKKFVDGVHIIESKGKHLHSFIWFHGFGDSADGCKSLFTEIQPPNTRIVLPNAPKKMVTIEGRKYNVRSWYEHEENDEEKGLQVVKAAQELIDEELKLVEDASHIILGGFR